MISYRIKYQTRRQEGKAGVREGDWQDKEMVVVAGDDAREAVDIILDSLYCHDFRLRGIKMTGQVSAIAPSLVSKTTPTDQVSQNTTG